MQRKNLVDLLDFLTCGKNMDLISHSTFYLALCVETLNKKCEGKKKSDRNWHKLYTYCMQNWEGQYKQNMVSYILLPEFHSQNFNSSFDNSLSLCVAHTHLTQYVQS